jgi:hypothetical protein
MQFRGHGGPVPSRLRGVDCFVRGVVTGGADVPVAFGDLGNRYTAAIFEGKVDQWARRRQLGAGHLLCDAHRKIYPLCVFGNSPSRGNNASVQRSFDRHQGNTEGDIERRCDMGRGIAARHGMRPRAIDPSDRRRQGQSKRVR